jgi:nucleotide-binding universal stress UspA family protein
MNSIVCATRGGEGSRVVQREAIRRAKEAGKKLVFLYVLDTSNMGQMEETLMAAVREELTWLGKALVNTAQQRARVENIEAAVVIREGEVQAEICRYLKETNASMLLLGAPRNTTAAMFGDDAVEQIASSIQKETGVSVTVVRPESAGDLSQPSLLLPGDSDHAG